MSKDRILLGRDASDDPIYLYKHSWDCDWYWGMGYLGNAHMHFHMESYLRPDPGDPDGRKWYQKGHEITTHLPDTWLTQDNWWLLRDLFIICYALKKAADCYQHGGHQTEAAKPHRRLGIKPEMIAKRINNDLGQQLDHIWALLHEWKGLVDEAETHDEPS